MIFNAKIAQGASQMQTFKPRPSAQHDEDMIVFGVSLAFAVLWSTMIFSMIGFTHFFVP